jgi:NAD(P)-dependent dehydrogenase (short-subunit alcohol dehydrogenase family)
MERILNEKIAIVTGGGTGIGEAISKKFAAQGAKVIVCGLWDDPIDQVVHEIQSQGGSAISYKGDMSEENQARDCVNFAIRTFGRLDILINNAGVFPAVEYIQDYPNEAFMYLMKNNIQSVFMMTKFAIPELQKTKGCIVSAGSESGLLGNPQNAPYAGTKGFIHAFTRSIAAEQAHYGVRANCVCPGPIDTSWMRPSEGPISSRLKMMYKFSTLMGRFGTTEEVANVYLFLASDLASYVTGSLYSVDGGMVISKGPMGIMADKSMREQPEGELNLQHIHEPQEVVY